MSKKKIGNSIVIYTFLMTLIQVTFIYISIYISTYQRMSSQSPSILPLLIYIFSPTIASLISIKLVTIRKTFEEDKNIKKYIFLSMIVSYVVVTVALGIYKSLYLAIFLLVAYIPTYDVAKTAIYKKLNSYEPKKKKKKHFEYKEESNLNCELASLNDYNISQFLKNRKVKTSNYFYALKTATASQFLVFGSFSRFRPKSYIIAFDIDNIYMYDIQAKTIKNEEIIKFIDIEKIKIKNILFNKAYEIKIKPKVGKKILLQANRKMNIIQNQENSIENLRKTTKKEK